MSEEKQAKTPAKRGNSRRAPRARGIRGERRVHLEERLASLNRRTMLIEHELMKLDDNRFYRSCIFGSARIKPESAEYKQVEELAERLATDGIDILTGGGPGLMEAANQGALRGRESTKNKSLSFGLSIQLEWEPEANRHLDIKHHHLKFSSRLDQFMRMSHSVICTPGGIGTLLELFFSWQLVQVKHIAPRPIVLLSDEFWEGLVEWMKAKPLAHSLVSAKDFDMIHLVHSVDEAYQVIARHHREYQEQVKIAGKA